MNKKKTTQIFAVVLCCIAIYILYFFHLTAMGLVNPDEPRYAAIGQAMARTGDWITPRLWREPWFEKPALLYWMTAAAFRLGLSADLAPRLPVALLSAAFLIFFYLTIKREFGARAALYSAVLLATSAGWVAYSLVGLTDLPLAATFSAAILLALPWIERGDPRPLPAAAAMLGLAVLAKGLVPLVLILPLFWAGRTRIRDLFRPKVLLAFVLVALPWYVFCYVRNGDPFIQTLFVQHTFGRFTSNVLQHAQPFWYYVPALLASVFPWVLLFGLLFRPGVYADRRTQFLGLTAAFGFVFFSAATNKLPGYLLPLLPAITMLMGVSLDRVTYAGELMLASTLLLVFIPAIGWVLPRALAAGIGNAYPVAPQMMALSALLIPLAVFAGGFEIYAARTGRPLLALAIAGTLVVASVFYLKLKAMPEIDLLVSARGRDTTCVPSGTTRSMRYGLNYYAARLIPDCK